VKTNKEGRECPSWCIIDHSKPENICCESESRWLPGQAGGASLSSNPWQSEPDLRVWVFGRVPGAKVNSRVLGAAHADRSYRAADLAVFLDALATRTPGEIRKLAQAAREMAAVEWEAE
jgi:hypothetical protein